MALSLKTKLFTLVNDSALPELLCTFFFKVGDTYADLRVRLEECGCVDWSFDFWDLEEKCRIRKSFDAMNPVTDHVYVIRIVVEDEGGPSK